MSLRWERFAGDTSDFAIRLSLHDDPDGLRGIDPDTSASWGAIEIWVGGVNICAHTDQGESLKAAHWYLLPLLEWVAENWDPMLHEERLPLEQFATAADFAAEARGPSADFDLPGYWEREELNYDWDQRHSLRAASNGGLLPDLRIRRLRDKVEFSWGRTPISGATDIEWQAPSGYFYADPTTTALAFHEVIFEAANQLVRVQPESQRFRQLAASVAGLRLAQRTEVRTAWLAGLGATAQTTLARWRDVARRASEIATPEALKATFGATANDLVVAGSCQAALLFGSASPTLADSDVFALSDALLAGYAYEPEIRLDELVRDEPLDAAVRPWAHGYDLAEDLLDGPAGTDLTGDTVIEVERFLQDYGVATAEVNLADSGIRAVSFASRQHTATILMNVNWVFHGKPASKRFTLAHELCHLLYDRTYGTQLAVASGPWAPRGLEQRANAFAAMLLMPSSLLRMIDSTDPFSESTPASVTAVANKLRVPRTALVDHLYNVGLVGFDKRERLRTPDQYEAGVFQGG